jgi:hypothetical protein
MTIAFQAFIVVLFILPGALFFSALSGRLSVDRELPLISATMTWAAIVSLVVAVIFHLVWQGAVALLAKAALFDVASGAGTVFNLVAFSEQSKEYGAAARNFRNGLGYMCVYFSSICAVAFSTGQLLNYLIRQYKLERTYKWLRFRPRWHYLLAGDDYEDAGNKEVTVFADLLTEIDGQPILYSGLVTKYWFDQKTDALDVILIAGARRQWMKSSDIRVTFIPSNEFAIKFSEVKNINIIYLVTSKKSASDVEQADQGETLS